MLRHPRCQACHRRAVPVGPFFICRNLLCDLLVVA
jgi:hypothetical protein